MIPDPKKSPELYDDYDCDERPEMSREYLDATLPDHVRQAMAERIKSGTEKTNETEGS